MTARRYCRCVIPVHNADSNMCRTCGLPIRGLPRQPDPAKGEYLDEHDNIHVCKACIPRSRAIRHTCGLSGLQDMLRLPGPR